VAWIGARASPIVLRSAASISIFVVALRSKGVMGWP
jgi:hypothetical protein